MKKCINLALGLRFLTCIVESLAGVGRIRIVSNVLLKLQCDPLMSIPN